MLEIQGLSAGYGRGDVLKNICVRIPSNAVTVLLGSNGCGKSTLLKALCGIVPARGEVLWNDCNLLKLPPKALARQVSYLSQSRQVPDITVERLVLHGRFPYLGYPRRYRKQDLAVAENAMEQMQIAHLADIPLPKLSGGQRQKAYIAMALAQDTPLLLLDEPTAFLDISTQMQLLSQAKALSQRGKTVVMVLHDIGQALEHGENVIIMEHGTIAAVGTPETVYASGVLKRIFSVQVKRLQTERGWHYYCEEVGR